VASRALRIGAGVALAVVVLGGACAGYQACDAHVTTSAAASAWSAYASCLVGDGVAPGQHLGERLRAIDLGLALAPDPAAAAGDWPARCHPHVEALLPLLASTARHDTRATLASDLATRLATTVDPGHVDPALVDALSDALVPLALPGAGATSHGDPPPPSPALADITRAALTSLGAPGVGTPAAPDPLPGASLRLAWGAHPPWACRFGAGLVRARCFEPHGVPPDAQLVPVAEDDAAASTLLRVFFTRDTPAGVYRAEDGQRIADDWKLPAFVRDDGTILEVAPVHAASVIRRSDGEIGLAIPGNASATGIASDAVVWTDNDRLASRVVDPDGSLGPIVDLGPLPPGDHSIAMCHSKRTLVVRVATGPRATTVFRTDLAWSAPIESPLADRAGTLACADDRATLTWLDHDVVHQIACAPRACTSGTAKLGPAWDVAEADHEVAALGDRVLALRRATFKSAIDTRPGEAVVARFAPLAGLADAKERILVADAAHGGVDPARIQAFVRDGVAVVVVTARDGNAWPMLVGREGDVKAVAVVP
jgi:hypothetical protein